MPMEESIEENDQNHRNYFLGYSLGIYREMAEKIILATVDFSLRRARGRGEHMCTSLRSWTKIEKKWYRPKQTTYAWLLGLLFGKGTFPFIHIYLSTCKGDSAQDCRSKRASYLPLQSEDPQSETSDN
ncbi:uncharacterized protein BDR25DRAFT_21992 [Lindgomyces ingoldianus]|uniref:Uncharacterized protein n=1 Tax=Lindgomyces ingoldianus TaxID=673940 RepID=A0ACB6QYM8_9PLEO|nr:uncharacterized protein BDR25DRAFT_21992 [Lindgomyces ingoldianus]KAF2471640.1 hypothetical protein BDR25DRAFT_21992 [Lindgomyces ingoldianus]